MFWFFCHKACANLSAQPGIKPTPPALEGKIPTPRLLGKSPPIILKRLWGGAGRGEGAEVDSDSQYSLLSESPKQLCKVPVSGPQARPVGSSLELGLRDQLY